jgi:hypothetical protein
VQRPLLTFGLTLLASCFERWLILGVYVSVGTYFLAGDGAKYARGPLRAASTSASRPQKALKVTTVCAAQLVGVGGKLPSVLMLLLAAAPVRHTTAHHSSHWQSIGC